MVATRSAILTAAERLSHDEACRLAGLAARSAARTVVLDLSHCDEASTSAFARMVLMRRELLRAGRDIWLAGLCGQPASLFEVHRLESVLPRLADLPVNKPKPAAHQAAATCPLSAVG